MERYLECFDERRRAALRDPALDLMEVYIRTGDASILAKLSKMVREYGCYDLAGRMPSPDRLDEIDVRALRCLSVTDARAEIGDWLNTHLAKEKPDQDFVNMVAAETRSHGITTADIVALPWIRYESESGLTSAGRCFVSLPDKDLKTVCRLHMQARLGPMVVAVLLCHVPHRLAAVLDDLLDPERNRNLVATCRVLIDEGGSAYEARLLKLLRSPLDAYTRFQIYADLAETDLPKHRQGALEAAKDALKVSWKHTRYDVISAWLLRTVGRDAFPEIIQAIKTQQVPKCLLTECVSILGKDATPILTAGLEAKRDDTRYEALSLVIDLDDGTNRQGLITAIEQGLRDEEPGVVIRHIGFAAKYDMQAVQDIIWPLIESKSKPMREAAARGLGKLGEDGIPRAAELLKSRKADIRKAAADLLTTINTSRAQRVLETHLDSEENNDVRDAILAGLQAAWLAAGKSLSREDIEERIAKGSSRLRWPPAPWAEALDSAQLRYTDGTAIPADAIRYLLSRQARASDIEPVIELRPVLALIDRSSSGDLALEMLHGFIRSGANAKDKWGLTVSGLLGDDRIVPVMVGQVGDWVDSGRGKLAEYAVKALALLGTDRALAAIDVLSNRYRTKMKNVGAAAAEAFNAVAESRGVTPEELGDQVVPWLGFEPGKPRAIDCAGNSIEIAIGMDFKLQLRDLKKGKRISSLPSSAPASLRREMKVSGELLREAVKAQLRRVESLMVQQYRWPADRWNALFLRHPLMVPFGVRLVWAAFDEAGSLLVTFRALEDRTLTGPEDEAIELPESCQVGIVHPLEIMQGAMDKWSSHLVDYEVQAPFPQLERMVVLVAAEQEGRKLHTDLVGTEINGMTFKGRAERLGWRRGSVCDAGSITAYMKSFRASGVDVFLSVESMFVGMDVYDSISLGNLFFVRHGVVETGSYVYDEPSDENDPRLIPSGQVPPVVFSEAMADLRKIAKGKESPETEEG